MAQLQELLRVFLERFQDGDNHDCAKQVQGKTPDQELWAHTEQSNACR